jgi:hypothetical protein
VVVKEPELCVSVTEDPNPEEEFVEISNPVGAVTVTSFVKLTPDTEKEVLEEAVPNVVLTADIVPEVDMVGEGAAPLAVILKLSIPMPCPLELPDNPENVHLK